MESKVAALKQPRFIDPKAPVEDQVENLQALINNPPENGRWVRITPKLAMWILENLNAGNRRKRFSNIKKFSVAMKEGGWTKTGDTIKFSRSRLLDGQNRLFACVLAGKAFDTLVVFGIEDEAFYKIDTNAKRTGTDTLKIEGVMNERIVASAVRFLIVGYDDRRVPSNDELLEYWREKVEQEELATMARLAKMTKTRKLISPGILAMLFYKFNKKSSKFLGVFAKDLTERKRGARKLLDQCDELRKQNMGRVHEKQQAAMVIQTWNGYRANQAVTKADIRWTAAKEFPAID